jgi:hypothetical protein
MIKNTITQLKKKLWKEFTLYVKLRESGDGETCLCITCGKRLTIGKSDCQGGHFFSKKGYSGLYFHEDNVWPQCYRCNINLEGNTQEYDIRLRKKIGNERVDHLYNIRKSIFKITRYEYTELIKKYKAKNKELRESFEKTSRFF